MNRPLLPNGAALVSVWLLRLLAGCRLAGLFFPMLRMPSLLTLPEQVNRLLIYLLLLQILLYFLFLLISYPVLLKHFGF